MKPPEQPRVTAIAQAVTDLLVPVSDAFLKAHNLIPGSHAPISSTEMHALCSSLPPVPIIRMGGGSLANTLHTLAVLGNETHLITTLGDDTEGQQYRDECNSVGMTVTCISNSKLPSAISLILITPSGERTMRTTLNCAATFNPDLMQLHGVSSDSWLLIEGYLCATNLGTLQSDPLTTLAKSAVQSGAQVAFTLSAPGVVNAFRNNFARLSAVASLMVGNLEEFCAFFGTQDSDEVIQRAKFLSIASVITNGEHGAISVQNGQITSVVAETKSVIDLTGAGDAFLAGYLHARIEESDQEKALKSAAHLAGLMVARKGARFSRNPDKSSR